VAFLEVLVASYLVVHQVGQVDQEVLVVLVVLVVNPSTSFGEDWAYNQDYFGISPWDQLEFQKQQLSLPSLAFPFLGVVVAFHQEVVASWIDFLVLVEVEAFLLQEVVVTCLHL
jgi:hypothetical protein